MKYYTKNKRTGDLDSIPLNYIATKMRVLVGYLWDERTCKDALTKGFVCETKNEWFFCDLTPIGRVSKLASESDIEAAEIRLG